MNFFSFFSSKAKNQGSKKLLKATLRVDALEERALMTANTISGFVYQDLNNNGIREPGENPLANVPIKLTNDQNVIVGQTTTDANGFYQFVSDNSITTTPATLTKTVVFPSQATNFTASGLLDQFDPSLGTLTSIEIKHEGSITSNIKVENTGTSSASTITAIVSGKLTLTAPGVSSIITLNDNAGSFNASAFDNNVDYAGTSGNNFGSKTASGQDSIFINPNDPGFSSYVGTGKVNVSENVKATSSTEGDGNLIANIVSTGQSQITVIYHYTPSNSLKPGNYVITEVTQPAGFLDGTDARNNIPIPNSVGTDSIAVVLANADLVNNNFGELPPPQISGYVYHDANNNGIKDAGEEAIPGATIILSGTDDLGAVNKSVTTNASGYYEFLNLRPGSYTLNETQPQGFIDGKDTAGTLGGIVTNDQIASIALPGGGASLQNNFGEIKAAGLSGYVYVDANNNGIKDGSEAGIANVPVNLTGLTASGPVSLSATTDANGFYSFNNLLPGTYSILEGATAAYLDGKDTIGSQGGQVSNDNLHDIALASGVLGLNNNFGELQPAQISGYVYHDSNNNGVKDAGELGIGSVIVTLSGTDDSGNVNKTATTDANGFYSFTNLRPGTYTLQESQPSGYIDGKDSLGTQGGFLANDQVGSIALTQGTNGQNNNFGEIRAASLSGYVYADSNGSNAKDAGDAAVANVTVTLTGMDDLGPVSKTATTDSNGFYSFANLRPGTYSLLETQPAGYKDGSDQIGSQGGTGGNDTFTNIVLPSGVDGINNNFGEIIPEIADLGIVKGAAPTVVQTGNNFTYTLTVTNYGTFTAQNVKISDTLPVEVTYVSATGNGWTITVSAGVLTATMPSLAVNASAQIFVTVKAPGVPTTVTNTGTVTSTTPDSNPLNNSSTVVTEVIAKPKNQDDPRVLAMGDILIYTKGQLVTNPSAYLVAQTRNSALADTIMRTLGGKVASDQEVLAAATALTAGGLASFLNQYWNSDFNLSAEVKQSYQTILGRAPSASELASGIQSIRAGSQTALSVSLIAGAEYQSTHPTQGLLAAGMYMDLTGVAPTSSAQSATVQALGSQTTLQVAQAIANSTDALKAVIDRNVKWILGRSATQADYNTYLPLLQSNALTSESLGQALFGSAEFLTRVMASQ